MFRTWFTKLAMFRMNRAAGRRRHLNPRGRLGMHRLEERITPAVWYVNVTNAGLEDGSLANPYNTIQEGVNAAAATSDGADIVNVAAGTYAEQVVIGTSLTLQGAGDTTIIQPTSAAQLTSIYTLGTQSGAFFNGDQLASVISVSGVGAAGVTIKDLTVDGENVTSLPAGASRVSGITYGETGGLIDNVRVEDTKYVVPASVRTYGIWLDAVGGANVSVGVTNSTVTQYGRNGVNARGNNMTVNIDTNTITGPGTVGPDQVPNGVLIVSGAGGTVTDNTISANHYTGTSFLGSGVLLFSAASGIVVSGNTITDTDDAVLLSGTNTATIQSNSLTGNVKGVRLEAGAANNTITNNFITTHTYGIDVGETAGAGNAASNNSITASTTASVNNLSATTFNASGNWWGSNDEATVADGMTGSVDFMPFLENSTDTDSSMAGFQGNFLPVITSPPQSDSVTEDGTTTAAGAVTFTDNDTADTHTASVTPQAGDYLGTFAIDSSNIDTGNGGTVGWSFAVDNAVLQVLAAGQTLTQNYDVTVDDGHTGGTAAQTVTITINGANDAAAIGGDDTRDLVEVDTAAAISTSGRLTIADVDGPAAFEPASNVAGLYGHFSISADGRWTYTADSAHNEFVGGQVYTDQFAVQSVDGTPATVTIRIAGTNNPAIIGGEDTAFRTETNSPVDLGASGTLTVSDVDNPATFQQQFNVPGLYGYFTINAAGHWIYAANRAHDEFAEGQQYTDSFTARSADGTEHTVTVLITGTNDAGAIGGQTTAQRTETNSAADLSASGTLTVSDVDSPATIQSQNNVAGAYGHFSIATDGTWAYVADSAHDEFVAGQVYTDQFTVRSADGTPATVTVSLTGASDAATFGGVDGAQRIETDAAADLNATGTLTVNDVDSSATFQSQSNVAGLYGHFGIDAAGHWTYTADSAHNEFAAGNIYTDLFTVRSADGTPRAVTIQIAGTNDAPVLTGLEPAALSYTEKSPATPVATSLTVGDADSPSFSSATVAITSGYVNGEDTLAYAQPSGNPVAGSFNPTSGVLTLTGPGTPAQFQAALGAVTYANTSNNPSTVGRTLTIQIDDGATANSVSIVATRALSVTAVNDPPAIGAPATATTSENSAIVFHTITVTDVDAGAGALAVTLTAAHGTLSLGSTANLGGLSGNGTAAVTFTGTLAAVNAALDGLTFTPDVNYSGPANVGVAVNDQGNTGTGGPAPASKLIAVTVQAFPRITGVQVGPAPDDDPNQRSRINRLLVSFSEGLTVHPDGAFKLVKDDTTVVPVTVSWDTTSQATLTFGGPDFMNGSLADGSYRLSVDGGQLTGASGQSIDGDGDHGAGGVFNADFYRLFGDANGDRVVNGGDITLLSQQFGSTNPTFDANGDGVVTGADLQAFIDNFGMGI